MDLDEENIFVIGVHQQILGFLLAKEAMRAEGSDPLSVLHSFLVGKYLDASKKLPSKLAEFEVMDQIAKDEYIARHEAITTKALDDIFAVAGWYFRGLTKSGPQEN